MNQAKPYFGVYYIKGDSAPVLCEVDGGVCYEAHASEIAAQASANAGNLINASHADMGRYVVQPIPAGVRVHDRESDSESVSGEHALALAEPHSAHAASPSTDTIVMRFAKMTVRRELYDVVPDGEQWMVLHDGKAIEPCLTEAAAWEYAFNVVDCII